MTRPHLIAFIGLTWATIMFGGCASLATTHASDPRAPMTAQGSGYGVVAAGSVPADGRSVPNPLLTPALSALAALLGAGVGYWSTQRSSRAGIIQKTNELEIESIDRRLSEFVGPFMQLSEENKTLAAELKRGQTVSDFRTLTALLTPGWRAGLSSGDASLLSVVVDNGVALRKLLMENGAAAVSPQLIPYFSKASTHFRFLELAYKGSLDENPARFGDYVYPRELDGIMALELVRLQTRRELLRSAPYRPHGAMQDLDLSDNLAKP
ncbi:hypothetical protein C8J45_1014 [Sphingomonas sp. PP-CE-3G-477]|uniref:hypothetical protein n=1 Tax=Sphingomonas sp. PP-CE-3G-477 TaxID=2135660 RepID=UPI000D39D793|nr:hypothetical protein [Sphingomonas sp. PP-CE-3G-477]PTQ65157.1 hypothetical protein C8J45_1014 [Sphingomonas sp. PP-CE-3G-477]